MDIKDKFEIYSASKDILKVVDPDKKVVDCFDKFTMAGHNVAKFVGGPINLMKFNLVEYERSGNMHILHFRVPAVVDGYCVINLSNLAHTASKVCVRDYDVDDMLVLDYSECDLSNIIEAQQLFTTGFDCVEVWLPSGDRMLQPLFMWKCSGSEIVNIEEVIDKTDFSAAVSLKEMVHGCKSIEKVDLRGKYIRPGVNLRGMFSRCTSLESVWFDKGQFKSVQNTTSMFEGCENLVEFDLGCFEGNSIDKAQDMFKGCSRLESVKGSWRDIVSKEGVFLDGLFGHCSMLEDVDVSEILSLKINFYACSIFDMCKSISLRDLYIHNNSIEYVESNLLYTGQNIIDIRGTRLHKEGKDVAISIVGRSKHNDCYFSGREILILDREQYEENKIRIDGFIADSNARLAMYEHGELECFFLKLRCFGIESINESMVIVDMDYKKAKCKR